ncbi:hypothetical protein COCSADRAFT_276270 [Bipolaris sorokiniana ND90Pr]|uniref:Uncharacterized protein n=1 Tax=Cochliobolus sativus (strain ND90Pr / ATCC 201652) TaxID=665912 RepID=M2RQ93_COCSN|nr:uncharacterized protein COCSADRAFT_276270 [Bipolaris sorokiniana ND90Pr]EMD68744.1 hypothetical protein COCSADRAFT_276270 [Bipolaris sorokiniana ND90Pr]
MPLGHERLCSAAIRWLYIHTVCNIPWAGHRPVRRPVRHRAAGQYLELTTLNVVLVSEAVSRVGWVAIGGCGLAVATPNLPQHGVHRCMHRWIAPVTRAFPV